MPKSRPFQILMVDDDHEDAYATRRALSKSGRPVAFSHFDHGEGIVDRLLGLNQLPDIILLDINMPRVNGFQVLEGIRGNPVLHHVPIVMLSTSQEPIDVERSYRLGANSFLSKPHSQAGLSEFAAHFSSYWLDLAFLPGR